MDSPQKNNYQHAGKSLRLINFLIDTFLVLVVTIIVLMFFPVDVITDNMLLAAYYTAWVAYYVLFESILGKTPGKIMTKTRVIHKKGSKAGAGLIILRSLLRLIPIDPMSYLFGEATGFHDLLSNTRVVDDSKNKPKYVLNK
jgi:uncharacterized RDD family membrane protein YckC